jgi:hypothetical protein
MDYTCQRLAEQDGYHPDAVVTLYPTSPFRPTGLIDTMVECALQGQSPAVTYKMIRMNPARYFHNCNGLARPVMPKSAPPRGAFRPYGLCTVQSQNPNFSPYVHVIEDPVFFIDIDDWEDLELAELALAHGMYAPNFANTQVRTHV